MTRSRDSGEAPVSAWAGLGWGLLALAALVGLDLVLGADAVLVGLYAIAPFVAAVTGGPRGTAAVAGAAVAAAAAGGLWNDGYTETDWVARLAVILVAGSFAVFAARARVRARWAEIEQHLLAEAAEGLASAPDFESALQAFCRALVPRLGDWSSVNVPGSNGELERIAASSDDSAMLDLEAELRAGAADAGRVVAISDVFETGVALALELPGRRPGRWALLKPIWAGGEVIGVLCLVNERSRRAFSDREIAVAKELGRRVGTAILNAKLASERAQIAATLEHELLPPPLPEVEGWNVAAMYRPAGGVSRAGGDFYDVFEGAEGWVVLLGDVEGHGAAAAALTAMVRYTVRTAALIEGDVSAALEILNLELRRREQPLLCSVVCITFGPGTEATVVSAGHPLPLLISGGEAREVGLPGSLLGALEHPDWSPVRIGIGPGEELALYTDGVIEAKQGEGERFGRERLAAVLGEDAAPGETVRRVGEAIDAFAGSTEDDAALVLLRREWVGEPAGLGADGGFGAEIDSP